MSETLPKTLHEFNQMIGHIPEHFWSPLMQREMRWETVKEGYGLMQKLSCFAGYGRVSHIMTFEERVADFKARGIIGEFLGYGVAICDTPLRLGVAGKGWVYFSDGNIEFREGE
jgi:hypothetical protein